MPNNEDLSIPGVPFLIASICVVFAIIAVSFVKDIKNVTVEEKNKSDVKEDNISSNTPSESNSQTKVKLGSSSSVTNIQQFEHSEDANSNLRKC